MAAWDRNFHSSSRQPTPVLLPVKSYGWRNLVGYSPWGRRELDTTEWLHFTSSRLSYKINGSSSSVSNDILSRIRKGIVLSLKKHPRVIQNNQMGWGAIKEETVQGDMLSKLVQGLRDASENTLPQVRGLSQCDRYIFHEYNKSCKTWREKGRHWLNRSCVGWRVGIVCSSEPSRLYVFLQLKLEHPFPCKPWLALHRCRETEPCLR